MTRRKSAAAATPKGHKRQLSTPGDTTIATPGTRSSKRVKELEDKTPTNKKAASTKSKYFEDPGIEDEQEEATEPDDISESTYDDNDDEEPSEDEPSEATSETDDYDSEEDTRQKKRGRVLQKAKSKSVQTNDQILQRDDLWKEGVKTGLGPGKQVFIAKPKPRGDGGIKYVPNKIHPNTMLFLTDLKKNNDREWLKMHDPDYRQSWKDWEGFVETITEKLAEIDETVPELPPKDVVFRIYRDVRFSKDPTPYKTFFSAAWSRTGRKGPYAHYYVQIQPGGRSIVGAGIWHPEAQPLRLLRRSIDRHPDRLRNVLRDTNIRKHVLGGVSNDDKKIVKAFTAYNAENALKSKPKGFEADHPNIELLRLRNYTLGKRISDEDVASPQYIEKVVVLLEALYPFVTFLNTVVMPDEDEDDDDDEDDEDGGAALDNDGDVVDEMASEDSE